MSIRRGFSIVEALLAGALFSLIVTALMGALMYGEESTVTAGARARAAFLADEGLEALRNIRDANFVNLVDGPHGLATSGNQWVLSGVQDVIGAFTRTLEISTLNSNTKIVSSTVTWQATGQRTGSIALTTRLTNWRAPSRARGGILVYGDGGTATDTVRYVPLDGATGIWGSVMSVADVDPSSTNKALRAIQVYASATRDEKVMISRHYNGSAQFIYAQVFDGANWGNIVPLSSWTASTFLDVQNFSGTYLANGDFMVIYSDNTAIPKFRSWNGTSWSLGANLPNIGGVPNYIVARARPGTNEVMAVFFDQVSDTNTAYFNGGSYVTSNWTLHAQHSGAAPVNTKQLIDFSWSPNDSLRGGLAYSNSGNDVSLNIRIWTANGSGGGSWSATANTTNQASRLGATAISGRRGADEFIACDKDANATPRVICYRSNFTPAWTNPANQTIAAATDTGIERSYDISFEGSTGDIAVAVYSDGTATPKLKKYSAATNAWDAAPASLNALTGSLETVRLIPHPDNDDIMILLGNTNQDFWSIAWDGVNNAVYASPAGKAFTSHGVSGSVDEGFWFDFAWDRF